MIRRFRHEWKEMAIRYANSCWHCPEYRYWSFEDASWQDRAETAMRAYRSALDAAYLNTRNHPRSRKAISEVAGNARQLAGLGMYLMESRGSNEPESQIQATR